MVDRVEMSDEQLQQWVERVSLQSFARPFKHRATFNRRLTSTGGRYFTHTHHIEISWAHLQEFGADDVEQIIKHELCHYHLHLLGMGFQHRDADFRHLLQRVGGSRYCKPLSTVAKRREPIRFKLICVECRTEYLRKRRVDPRKYACGKCRGRLKLQKLDNDNGTC